jgi:hypothetical protein
MGIIKHNHPKDFVPWTIIDPKKPGIVSIPITQTETKKLYVGDGFCSFCGNPLKPFFQTTWYCPKCDCKDEKK